MGIPNLAAATWEAQARLFSTDIAIWEMSAGGHNGVISGCAVTAQAPEAMAVDVAAGLTKLAGAQITVAGNAVAITAAHGTYARLDVIYVDDLGVADVATGTAAPAPVPEALPADCIGIAFVYVPAADAAVGAAQITDKRVFVQAPLGESQWTTVSKAADETRSNTAVLAADTDLIITMAANTKYRIRGLVMAECLAASDFKFGITGPASPTRIRLTSERGLIPAAGGSVSAPTWAGYVAYDTTGLSISSTGNFTGFVRIEGVITNGANPGDLSFTWGQNVAVAENTTVLAGSFLEYEVA